MAEIRVLPSEIADKIAAGEVAERPSAVVKELVENSIDAGASRIRVEIKNGGVSYISVEDNGKGIDYDELESAFLRHATSKLRDIDDLYEIQTMGFRGEALASICAVADVEVISRARGAQEGAYLKMSRGIPGNKETIAANEGTTMVVENLFASVPARMKFLKKDSTEAGYVADVMGRIALSKPEIAFQYICDGKEVFSTSGDGKLKNAVLNIYGIECAKGVLEVDYEEHGIRVSGVCGRAELSRGNRTRQTLFVNGRYIKNHVVSKVVEEAYRNILMTGRFPFFILNISIAPELVDVNVHPAKTEIKLANEKEVYDTVHRAVRNALYNTKQVAESSTVAIKKDDIGSDNAVRNKSAISFNMPETKAVSVPKSAYDAPTKHDIREYMDNIILAKKEETQPTVFCEDGGMNEGKGIAGVFTHEIECKKLAEATSGKSIDEHTESLFGDMQDGEGTLKREYNWHIVGQAFDTYVIAWENDKLYMIDQHAAHERKRFEMLKETYKNAGISGQVLMQPIVMSVDDIERQIVKENIDEFEKFGFNIDEFGRGAVIIRETPILTGDDEIKDLVLELVSIFKESRPSGLLKNEERALDMIACKYAIKANKKLNSLEMEAILKDVGELEKKGITTCPHGRPIKIEFTKREIEKLFKRIV